MSNKEKNKTQHLIVVDDETMGKLRKLQLEMLDAFVKICKDHDLTYFLVGGTALGAIRHKGYIPWDDDVDVGMLRPDYDKFREIAPKELPPTMFYQSMKTDPNYTTYVEKIRYNNSIAMQTEVKHMDIHHGVWLDVFPFDGCPDCPKEEAKKRKKAILYSRAHGIDAIVKAPKNQNFKMQFQGFLLRIYKTIIGKKRLHRKLNKLFYQHSVEDSKYVTYLLGRNDKPVSKELYVSPDNKTGTAMFCGKEYSVPYKIEAYLTSRYNDYMTLPPIEKQVSHHAVEYYKFPDDIKDEADTIKQNQSRRK